MVPRGRQIAVIWPDRRGLALAPDALWPCGEFAYELAPLRGLATSSPCDIRSALTAQEAHAEADSGPCRRIARLLACSGVAPRLIHGVRRTRNGVARAPSSRAPQVSWAPVAVPLTLH